jgi:multiple sugar transport system substrate-binding protein
VGSAATVACPDSTTPETITWLNIASSDPSSLTVTQKTIADFQAANPTIKINSVPVPFSDMSQQFQTLIASGNAPDVADTDPTLVPTFVKGGILAPLEGYDPALLSRFVAAPVQSVTQDGHLYALPWDISPLSLLYNRDLMTQAGLDPKSPPKTVDAFTAALEQVKAKLPNVTPFGMDTTIRANGLINNWGMLHAFGAALYDANGKAVANSPQMISYLDWIRKLVSEGLLVPNKKQGQSRPVAAANQLAFDIDATIFKGGVLATDTAMTNDAFDKRWGVTVLPAGADGKNYTALVGSALLMTAASTHKCAAWKFMAYVASADAAIQDYIIPLGMVAATTDAPTKFPALNDVYVTSFIDTINKAETPPPPLGSNFEKISTIFMTQLQRAFATSDSTADIASTMQDQLSKVSP